MSLLCRVWVTPDGSVRVTHPAPDARLDGEDDLAFCRRVFGLTRAADPTLADLPYVDIDPALLPDRAGRDAWAIHPDAMHLVTLTDDRPIRRKVVVSAKEAQGG
jgi:hypothetical protein